MLHARMVGFFNITTKCLHSCPILYPTHNNEIVCILFKLIKIWFSNKIPSSQHIFFYFLIAISFICPCFYLMPKAFCPFENENLTDFSKYWDAEVPIPKLFVGIQNQRFYIMLSAYSLTVHLLSYILSIIFARKTLLHLKGKFLFPKTKALQEQLSKYAIYFFFV